MTGFLNFYNQKRKHITTNKIPAEIFRKYDDPTIRKVVVMATEQSRKRHLTQIAFEWEGEEVSVTNWRHQIRDKKAWLLLRNTSKRDLTSNKREIKYKDKNWEDSS